MKMSEDISALVTAISAAQGEIEDATKKGLNPAFRSKYADMAAVRTVIREPLAKHGLSIVQCPRTVSNGANSIAVEVETTIFHKSGEFISETLRLPVVKQDAQGIGSAITYARRYMMMSMLALASEDDDGNAASNVGAPQKTITSSLSATDVLALKNTSKVIVRSGLAETKKWFKSLRPDQRSVFSEDEIKELVDAATEADQKEEF